MNKLSLKYLAVMSGCCFSLAVTPAFSVESPSSLCSEQILLAEQLSCLQNQIQQLPDKPDSAKGAIEALMPSMILFLGRSPNMQEPPLPWLKPLSSGKLLKSLAAELSQPHDDIVIQHLLRLFQYVLIMDPKRIEPALQASILKSTRKLSQANHPLTRLLALDLLLYQRQDADSTVFKALMQDVSVNEKMILLLHYQKWQKDPRLAKSLPAIPAQTVLNWVSNPNYPGPELKTWTFHPRFQKPLPDFSEFMGEWLETAPADTIKFSEGSLKNLLQAPAVALRQYAIKRLALTGNPTYLAIIEPSLMDLDPRVQATARKAMEDLQNLKPLYYLDSLKDPRHLPSDTDQRLAFLFEQSQQFIRLFEPAFRHLHARPEFKRLLWQSLHNGTSADLQLPALKLVKETYPVTDIQLIEPMLARSQDVRVRSAALQILLKQPYQAAGIQLLQAMIQDPQVELSLAILHDLFQKSMFKDTRTLLNLLAKRASQKIDRSLVGFEDKTGSTTVEAWVAEHLPTWIKSIKGSENLRDFLLWLQDDNLPLSWRRAVIKHVGNTGQDQMLLAVLQQLAQKPDLELDAEFAMQAIQTRLDFR